MVSFCFSSFLKRGPNWVFNVFLIFFQEHLLLVYSKHYIKPIISYMSSFFKITTIAIVAQNLWVSCSFSSHVSTLSQCECSYALNNFTLIASCRCTWLNCFGLRYKLIIIYCYIKIFNFVFLCARSKPYEGWIMWAWTWNCANTTSMATQVLSVD